ncbi:hypothetical protein GCM10009712_20440 [Pseudarthrobacter sulfonivorans]|uniref:hypothetical protein n=1 Tax=Pseudarthrobacter sulfonivorans TaxID=121292 RepID=UPI00168B8DCF|nr:hypothetical protein [Pseudarthrobacter sulfonivorans]
MPPSTSTGTDAVDRLILTHDKTTVHGDVLIDDKGIITGAAVPSSKHLIHDQSVTGVPRVSDWRDSHGHVHPLIDRVTV